MTYFVKYMLLYFIIIVFFSFGRMRNSDEGIMSLIFLITMGVGYRFIVLFERINIKNLSYHLQKSRLLSEKQTKSLISEIELSLDKVSNFANWSCGILATISIFAVSTFINFFKDILSKEELMLLLNSNKSDLQSSLIGILGQIIVVVISALRMYYLTIQTFTYDRRFVNTILKSSMYIDENDEIIIEFRKKINYTIANIIPGLKK